MLDAEISCGMGTAGSQRRLLAEAGCCVTVPPVAPSGVTGREQAPELGPRGENGGVVLKGCSCWGNSCFQAAWILRSVPNTHTAPTRHF